MAVVLVTVCFAGPTSKTHLACMCALPCRAALCCATDEELSAAYQEVKDVRSVGRGIGLWGDMVIELRNGDKIELRSLDKWVRCAVVACGLCAACWGGGVFVWGLIVRGLHAAAAPMCCSGEGMRCASRGCQGAWPLGRGRSEIGGDRGQVMRGCYEEGCTAGVRTCAVNGGWVRHVGRRVAMLCSFRAHWTQRH